MILTTVEVPDCVPAHLKELLRLLTGEVQDLHCARCLLWELWDQSETVTLINLAAPRFFTRLQAILFEHLVSGIARLTDPPSTGRNKNLVLADLFDPPVPEEIALLQAEAVDIRKIRSKIVVHLDASVGLDPSKLPNQEIFRKVRRCTELMVALIVLAWRRHADGRYCMPDTDTMEIVNCLKKSSAYDELEAAGAVMKNFWNAPEDMKRDWLKTSRQDDHQ